MIELDVSGVGVRLEGLPSRLADDLRAEWPAFAVPSDDPDPIVVTVAELDRALTPGRAMIGPPEIERSGGSVVVRRDEGELTCDAAVRAVTLRLAQGDDRRRLWGLMNLLAAALAWRLLGRGGGAIHAAAIVVRNLAFLLIGAEGAGKTTWAQAAGAAGAPVISDDIVFLDARSGRLEALGTPIRDRGIRHSGPGRWPVAAFLLPRHGAPAELKPATRLALEARLAANLLFVAPGWTAGDPSVDRALDSIASGAPARTLVFPPDASFLPLLQAFSGA